MVTAEEREKDFLAKLEKLLIETGAELQVKDDGRPYGMHSGIVEITMNSIYDYEKDRLEKDFCEFELPTYMP